MIDPRKLLIDHLSEIRAMIDKIQENKAGGLQEMRRRETIYVCSIRQLNLVLPDSHKFQVADNETSEKLQRIEKEVLNFYRMSLDAFREKTNEREVIEARYIFNFLVKEFHPKISNTQIANYTNNDSSTIWYSVNKIKGLLNINDKQMNHDIQCLRIHINQTYKIAS